MKNGSGRFNFYLRQLQNVFDKAREQKDPAEWLFSNNARTPVFMLEGLSRLYAAMHDKKKFSWLKDQFKSLEDQLGQVDYYHSLSLTFSGNKKIPERYTGFNLRKLEDSKRNLNRMLIEEKWISPGNEKFKKISGKLKKAGWLKPSEEIKAITAFYMKSIKRIRDFAEGMDYHFDNLEEDVHELRRKLRWLSIYPQAAQGIFQYGTSTRTAAYLKKYMTPEITGSPYNKLPEPGINTSFLVLDKSRFLALSWMIAKLGELKDEGLLVTGLSEIIRKSSGLGKTKALAEASRLTGIKKDRIQELLDEAEANTRTFIKEKILDHLLTGTESTVNKKEKQPAVRGRKKLPVAK